MKGITKQIVLIERIDQLIRLKATGSPKSLAKRLAVSEATLFRIIDVMKELNAPIRYDLQEQRYYYETQTEFKCGFYVKELSFDESKQVNGGISFERLQNIYQILIDYFP